MEEIIDGVSVIICCHNGSGHLEGALKFLWNQNVREVDWEVIFVDNNSSDGSAEMALKDWKSSAEPVSFKIIKEPNPGLINARIAGVKVSKFEIIVFCDDDNWLLEDYVFNAYKLMNKEANAGVLGGKSTGFYFNHPPVWFSQFHNAYAIGDPATDSGILNNSVYIAGAGMVIRRSVFSKLLALNYNFLLSGRSGRKLCSGDDVEICILFKFLGFDLYYDKNLKFYHHIIDNRLTWNYCYKMISEGHSIPAITINAYAYIFRNYENRSALLFSKFYKQQLRSSVRKFFSYLRGGKSIRNFKDYIFKKEGSKVAIKMKSERNKINFLLFNRRSIKSHFDYILEKMPDLLKLRAEIKSTLEAGD